MITRSWKDQDSWNFTTEYTCTRAPNWIVVEVLGPTDEATKRYALDRMRLLWNDMATGDTVHHHRLTYLNDIVDKFDNILLNEQIEKELASHNTGEE